VGEATQGAPAGSKAGKKVNINTAGIEELDTLNGIGEATARDIIEYREKNGGFKKIEDIMKITGIKESKFNKIKDSICVE
jgi:competence protein ComEA